MALKLDSKKATKKKQAAPTSALTSETVTEYVEKRLSLEAKLAALKSLQKEVDDSEAEILKAVDETTKADASRTINLGDYVVEIGPKGLKITDMDKPAIREKLGTKLANEIATYPVGELSKYLSENELEALVTRENLNKRRVVIKRAEID